MMIPARSRPGLEVGQRTEGDVELDRAAGHRNRLDPRPPGGVGRVAQQAQRHPRVGVHDDDRSIDPLAGFELDPLARHDPGHRHTGRHHGAGRAGGVAEEERDHAHPPLDVPPHAGHAPQPARGMVEVDRRRPRVERAGVGADDPLTEQRDLQPLVAQVMLDELDHRPLEQELARLVVAADPLFELGPRGRSSEPEVSVARGPQGVAEPALDVAEGAPAGDVARREPGDLGLALRIVVPELDALTVLERHEQPGAGREPVEPAAGQVELGDDPGMQQPGEIGTG